MDNHGLRPIDRLVCKTFIARETLHRTMMAARKMLNRYLPGECRVEPRITLPTLLGLLPDLLTDDLMMFLITLLNENCSLASLISKAGEI